jgi:hypothetical protein
MFRGNTPNPLRIAVLSYMFFACLIARLQMYSSMLAHKFHFFSTIGPINTRKMASFAEKNNGNHRLSYTFYQEKIANNDEIYSISIESIITFH